MAGAQADDAANGHHSVAAPTHETAQRGGAAMQLAPSGDGMPPMVTPFRAASPATTAAAASTPSQAPQRESAPLGPAPGRRSVHGRAKGPIRVLSVDDDPVNQMVVQSLLEPQGFKVGAQRVESPSFASFACTRVYRPSGIPTQARQEGHLWHALFALIVRSQ
jgi:PleD family two-component response regulator